MRILTLCVVLGSASYASAEEGSESVQTNEASAEHRDGQSELVYITPILGAEYIGLSSAALRSDFLGISTDNASGVGFAFGGHAGFMFGPFRLGAMYQRTELFGAHALNFNKLYGEVGLGGRRGIVGINATLSGGWTFFTSRTTSMRNGGGARATFALDFYATRWFSIGPEIAVDGAGFVANRTVYGAWGLTGALRLGVHI